MKLSFEHLPKAKQTELRKLTSLIRTTCDDVEKIILYGSYARGNFKKDEDQSRRISDYNILVVTERWDKSRDLATWNDAQQLNLSAPTSLIAIDIEKLNENLSNAHYLYSDIEKEGIMLFDTKKHKLAVKKKLKNFEAQRIAQEHFDYWFGRANDFVDSYKFLLQKNKTVNAALQLNQIVESCYKTILLVFTNHIPHEYHLKTLGKLAEKFHPDLPKLFAIKNPQDRERFELLEQAYIGARFDPKYKISKENLEILAKDVVKLLNITEKACKARIFNFRN